LNGVLSDRVLGTRVFQAREDEPTALLISDLHVPADGGVVLSWLRAVLAAARRLQARVHVLGDLFDSYVTPGQVKRGVWGEVAEMFAAAAAGGVAIDCLHGNRDFLLGPEFVAASRARIVAGGLRGRIGGVDTLLLHGDELCQNDLPYQRAKRWLRHPATRWLARALPVGIALRVAERARRKSRMVIAAGNQQRFLPTAAAIEAAFGTGASRLVFGHIHRHCHGSHRGGDYWVLPAFDASGVGLLASPSGIGPVRCHGSGELEPLPVPPPCPFAS
jgi:UDP-2,3-diacylglucosamine hydrolase